LLYVDDVNILCGHVHNINKNTEALLVATKETVLEVNAEVHSHIWRAECKTESKCKD